MQPSLPAFGAREGALHTLGFDKLFTQLRTTRLGMQQQPQLTAISRTPEGDRRADLPIVGHKSRMQYSVSGTCQLYSLSMVGAANNDAIKKLTGLVHVLAFVGKSFERKHFLCHLSSEECLAPHSSEQISAALPDRQRKFGK